MGTHVGRGFRLLSGLSAATTTLNKNCLAVVSFPHSRFLIKKDSSSCCGFRAKRLSCFLQTGSVPVLTRLTALNRPHSSDAYHRDEDDLPIPHSKAGGVRPSRDRSFTSDIELPDSAKQETLFAKEFRQLDDLKEELNGRKSTDIAGKSRPRRRVKPNLQPSFNFASYVNESPLLTELIRLGVNLTKWEKGTIPDEVIRLDVSRDLGPIVRHLRKLGVAEDSDIGKILTQNPYVLIHGFSRFKEKTDYFQKKKFTPAQLSVIMKGAPQLFSRSVEAIDARLGLFQKSFTLTGDQLRETVVEHPELFQVKLDYLKKTNFCMNKTLEFKPNEIRELFITVPSIFTLREQTLVKRFDQLHSVMMIPHQSLVKFPYLLKVPLLVVIQRHKFLQTVEKAIYDPLEDGYTSLTAFTEYDDERFATTIARVDYETYKDFLKTL